MLNAVVVLGVVAILALLITAAVVGQRLVGGERRVFRKWCGIWSVGVLLCLPGLLRRGLSSRCEHAGNRETPA